MGIVKWLAQAVLGSIGKVISDMIAQKRRDDALRAQGRAEVTAAEVEKFREIQDIEARRGTDSVSDALARLRNRPNS